LAALALLVAATAAAAPPAASLRAGILMAEMRRASRPHDLAVIRSGLQSDNADVVRAAVRALGRLERPALAVEILPFLKSAFPEVRAEAANALAQAMQEPTGGPNAPSVRRTGGALLAGPV